MAQWIHETAWYGARPRERHQEWLMSQPTFEVQSANLVGEHARHVDEVKQQILAQLRTLIQELEPVAQQWQGSAAAAFQRLKADYSDKHVGLDRVLGQISQALAANQSTYNTAETDSHQTLTRVNAGTSAIQNKMNPQV
jgi:WXG100 family type VII secretion target